MARLVSIILILGLLTALPAADAQQPGKVYRIGVLWSGSPESPVTQALLDAFRQGLQEHRYAEGRNITFEHRYAKGKYDLFPELVAELVRLKVDIIVVPGTSSALAAKQATKMIPIVMVAAGDPVGTKLVASLARPGGNITGHSILAPEIVGKQLELLKETVPRLSRVAVLRNPAQPLHAAMSREAEVAARALGVQLQLLEVRGPDEFDSAFSAMTRERAGALLVLGDGMFLVHRTRLADLTAKSRLPAIYGLTEHVEAGGLMAYAPNFADLYRRAAYFVDKILKGAKPVDLPVEQPTRFELVLNLKTARTLGLTIPQSILIRADQVIE